MRKLIILLMLAIFTSVFAAPAFAQDDTTFCGDLAAADCDLLAASTDAMLEVYAATTAFDVQIDVENIPNAPTLNININGTGAYSLDPAVAAMMMDMGMDASAEDMMDASMASLEGFDAELALTITLPEELATQASLPGNVIDLQLSLVDGIGYINFDSLDTLLGGMLSAQGLTGWGGIDFVDFINQAMASNPEMMDAFSQGFNMGLGSTTGMDLEALGGLTQYISIERGDDEEGTAVFTTTVDFAGMATDPAFQELVKAQVEATGQAMTDTEFQQAMGIFQVIAGQITFEVTQYIDLETNYQVGVYLSVEADLTSLLAASGETVDGDAIVAITVDFSVDDFNDVTVSAPDNASIAPTEMLMGMMGAPAQ